MYYTGLNRNGQIMGYPVDEKKKIRKKRKKEKKTRDAENISPERRRVRAESRHHLIHHLLLRWILSLVTRTIAAVENVYRIIILYR